MRSWAGGYRFGGRDCRFLPCLRDGGTVRAVRSRRGGDYRFYYAVCAEPQGRAARSALGLDCARKDIYRLALISVDASRLRPVKGRIIVANHPSLIDVVLLTAAMPGVFSVAKSLLRRNPFIGFIVSRVMLTDDEKILDEARSVLSGGGNVLIFPEGTRTPLTGESPRLHRGAAQLSVRLGVSVAPVRIEVSRRILAKHQSILDMGAKTVAYRLVAGADIFPPQNGASNRVKAIELTRSIANALRLS